MLGGHWSPTEHVQCPIPPRAPRGSEARPRRSGTEHLLPRRGHDILKGGWRGTFLPSKCPACIWDASSQLQSRGRAREVKLEWT